MYNLTFSERERMAYANGNLELAAICADAAEFEEQNETLSDQLWEFETLREFLEEQKAKIESLEDEQE